MGLECPHCRERITVEVNAGIQSIRAGAAPALTKGEEWWSTLDPDEQGLASTLEASGVVAAYLAAYTAQGGSAPDVPLRSMWGFFSRAVETRLPVDSLKYYKQTYSVANVRALIFNGVVAVLCNGTIKEFVPAKMFKGSKVRTLAKGEIALHVKPAHDVVERWTKTKHGYIADGAAFSQMMSRRSIGAFADVR